MEKYMNKPEVYAFTDDDVVKEYKRLSDLKRVAGIYSIDVKEVKRILKHKGVI